MHKVQLISVPTFGLSSTSSICCPFPFLVITTSYFCSKSQAVSELHPHAIGVGLSCQSSSPPLLLLAPWRSLSWSLFEARHPPRNGDLCIEMIWSRCSFTTPFLVIDPPSLPPTTRAASWSMKLLPSTPRRRKLSIAKVASLWLCSSKDTCPGRA